MVGFKPYKCKEKPPLFQIFKCRDISQKRVGVVLIIQFTAIMLHSVCHHQEVYIQGDVVSDDLVKDSSVDPDVRSLALDDKEREEIPVVDNNVCPFRTADHF